MLEALTATHVGVGLLATIFGVVFTLYRQAMRNAAREALQDREIEELKKWKDARSDRDKGIYDKLDEIVQRLASLEALVKNGRDR